MQPRRAALAWIALGHAGMAAWTTDARLTIALGALWPRAETVAYTIAVLMPIERAAGHLWSWAHHLIPGHPPGDPLGWGPALLWASYGALIMLNARSTQQETA